MIFICIYLTISVCGLVTKLCLTLVTPWTVACQAPLSMGFSRQEYWSGLPFPSLGIFWTQKSNLGLLHYRQSIYWLSYEGVFATPWTVTCQTPLSLGFSRQEYWSGWPQPPPGHLPDPGIEPASLPSPTLASGFFFTSATWKAQDNNRGKKKKSRNAYLSNQPNKK